MPIFEYECGKCGLAFERVVLASRREGAMKCPACGSKKVEQLYSSFSGISRSASGATRSFSSG